MRGRTGIWGGLILALLCWVGAPESAEAEPVYRYRGEGGRPSFTNVRNLAPSTATLEELDLPSLVHLDLSKANAAELQRINERLGRAHRELTAHPTCMAAVEEGKVPWYQRVYQAHPEWIGVGGILLFITLVSGFYRRALPGGMWGRTVMLLLPMILGVGIVGNLARSMASTLHAVHEEADACASELEPAVEGDHHVTRRRAAAVHSVQEAIHQRERRMQQTVDALSKEYQI